MIRMSRFYAKGSLFFSLARNPLDQIPTTPLRAVKSSLEFLDLTEIDISVVQNHDFHGLVALKRLFLNNLRQVV